MEVPQALIIGFCDAIINGSLECRDVFEERILEEGGESPNFKCLNTEEIENLQQEAQIIKEEKSKRKLVKPTWIYKKPIRENKVIVQYENVVKNKTNWISFSPDAKYFIKHFLATIKFEVGIYYEEGGSLIDCITTNCENTVLPVLSELPIISRINIRCRIYENKVMEFLSSAFPRMVNLDANTLVATYIGNFMKYIISFVVSFAWKSKCKISAAIMERICRGISIHSKTDFSEVWFMEANEEIYTEVQKQVEKRRAAKYVIKSPLSSTIIIDTKDEPEDDEDDEDEPEDDEEDEDEPEDDEEDFAFS